MYVSKPTSRMVKLPLYMKNNAGMMSPMIPPQNEPSKPSTVLSVGMNKPHKSAAVVGTAIMSACFQYGNVAAFQ